MKQPLMRIASKKKNRHLDGGVFGNDAGAAAGGIQQHSVHRAHAQHLDQQLPVSCVPDEHDTGRQVLCHLGRSE